VLFVAAGLFYAAVRYLRSQPLRPRTLPGLGALGLFVSTSILLHLLGGIGSGLRLHGLPLGGAAGEYGAELFIALVGTVGTLLLTTCLLLLSLLATTEFSVGKLAHAAAMVGQRALPLLHSAAASLRSRLPKRKTAAKATAAASGQPDGVPAPVKDYGDDRDQRPSGRPLLNLLPPRRAAKPARTEAEEAAPPSATANEPPPPIIIERKAADSPVVVAPQTPRSPFGPKASSEPAEAEVAAPAEPAPSTRLEAPAPAPSQADDSAFNIKDTIPCASPFPDAEAAPAEAEPEKEPAAETSEPLVVMPKHESPSQKQLSKAGALAGEPQPRPSRKQHGNYVALRPGPYLPPPLSVFDYEEPAQRDLDRRAMLDLAQRLEGTLGDYQVKGRVTAIHPGPVVTMYEFVPAPGTKLSKITALSSDLAMALEALRVRIVAPIPGKAAVGIEVPNRTRETVYLKEIVADQAFTQARGKLNMALGKDISGAPVCVDLAKMPHLLVAGTTGSGKSVSVNGMVCSLLCNASPDDVKMIMIDPKMLELSIYEGIPHLLLPVVTDPKKANLALKWAVDEMERRYELISKAGLRDIGGYNKKVEKQLADIAAEQTELFGDSEYDIAERPQKLPYIVVLIDEFADLMMVASKEVETSVARIAQKARAAGIHLILATQRPSVDVITGLIKANFPSRIAFQVASRIDSRTILDAQGAENLLGMGDMLFTDRGQALRRVHGALITDAEVHRVVEHLKQQGQPIYDLDILKPRADEEGEEFEEDMSDELYDQAVRLVAETRQASISMVQRRLRIGYNRAARMIERMEREGIVSAADGPKGREVLISSL
jgi:S-DNA-T family DNA segregation ATPase FtsK/SpoIIIE